MHTNKIFRRWRRVIGQNNIREYPHKIINAGKLTDVDIAV